MGGRRQRSRGGVDRMSRNRVFLTLLYYLQLNENPNFMGLLWALKVREKFTDRLTISNRTKPLIVRTYGRFGEVVI